MAIRLVDALIFLAPLMIFAFPGGYFIGALGLSVIGLGVLIKGPQPLHLTTNRLQTHPALLGFGLYVVLHTALTFYHGDPVSNYGNAVPFILFPFILVALSQVPADARNFWLGAAFGGLLALVIAFCQIYLMKMDRAIGFRNPILFGNTSVVLGSAALIGLIYCRQTFQKLSERAILLAGGVSGLLSSLLSGSKGGWLSLLMVVALAINSFTKGLHWARRLLAGIAVFAVLAAIVVLGPRLVVIDRIVSAYHGTKVWFQTGEISEGSASARLEAFKAGLIAGAESPVFGLGKVGQFAAIEKAIDEGKIRKEFMDFKVIDNDFISLFATKGLLGVLAAVAVHLGIFVSFYRYRNDASESIRALATMGMLLVILYIEFGLSVSVFGTNIFRVVYVSWAMILGGLILSQSQVATGGDCVKQG